MASPSDFPNIGLAFPPCDAICEQLTFFHSTEYPQYLTQASALFARENGIVRLNEVLSNKIPKTFWHQKQTETFHPLRHSTSLTK
jgi:hypothetical protein